MRLGPKMTPAILVTGGAGYVGSHTVAALLERGLDATHEIVVVDNTCNAYKDPDAAKPEALIRVEKFTGKSVQYYQVDIRDANALSDVFDKHSVECVIHFAALKAVGESVEMPLEYYQTNITGTCVLFEVMKKHGVHKMVYSSSCTVYGDPQKLPLDENHVTGIGLTSPYGKSKYFCEEIMKDLCKSNPMWTVISLRYFNPVGAHHSGLIGEDPTGIPNNLMPYISQVAVGRREYLQVYGSDYDTLDGTGVRDYIHVEDLASGHVHAIEMCQKPDSKGFHAINLGTGTGYSVLQMVSAFEAASGHKVPYKLVGRRPGDIAASYADADLAETLLGWKASKNLQDMCADTWRWQSSNPAGFASSS